MKINSLIFFFLLSILTCKAQQFNSGLEIGINGSQIQGDDIAGYSKPGMVAGLFTELQLEEQWGFRIHLRYTQKGSRSSSESFFFFIWRTNYLEAAPTLRFAVTDKIGINGGPAIGYLLSSKQNLGFDFSSNIEDMKLYDLAFSAGVEYRLTNTIVPGMKIQYSIINTSNVSVAYHNWLTFNVLFFFNAEN